MEELFEKHKKKILAALFTVLASLGVYLSADTKDAIKGALDGAPVASETAPVVTEAAPVVSND